MIGSTESVVNQAGRSAICQRQGWRQVRHSIER